MERCKPEVIMRQADDNLKTLLFRCGRKDRWKILSVSDTDTDSTGSDYDNIDITELKEKKHDMLPRKIIFDIGGQKFATLCSSLTNHPNTKLGRLNKTDESYDKQSGEHFFDRNPALFPYILDFYRTGELHFPHDMCGPFIQRELQFWNISELYIAPCCWKTYKAFEEERHTIDLLESMFDGRKIPKHESGYINDSGYEKWLRNIWLFLEFPGASIWAKVWAYVYMLLLVCSIAVICLDTHPDFRVPGQRGSFCRVPNVNATFNNKSTAVWSPSRADIDNPKAQMYVTTIPHPVLEWLDHTCTSIFSAELLLRFFVWPKKIEFFKSFFNVMDLMAVFPMFIIMVVVLVSPCFWVERGFVPTYVIMSFVCVFRAIRILKLVKHSRGLQIMYLAIKASLREILLLLLLIIIGTLIFSTMIYYAEFGEVDSFMNIPIGFWWSIVTMTTVGYGDTIPKTALGYLVASVCALTGMLITGLPIPVIANSFHLYYAYAKLKDKLELQKQTGDKSLSAHSHHSARIIPGDRKRGTPVTAHHRATHHQPSHSNGSTTRGLVYDDSYNENTSVYNYL